MKKKSSIDLLNELEGYVKNINDEVTVISTGVTSLDVALGTGGIPLGKFVEIYGSEGTGKTTLALTIANEFLKYDPRNVLYCDSEQALSKKFIELIIDKENLDRFVLIQPGILEEALRACEKGVYSGECSLIILDSIGSLAPQAVIDKELEDRQVSLLSRILTTFLQRTAMSVRESNCVFIGVNQIRDKIGSYIKEFSTPGGHAWRHITSFRIELKYSSIIKEKETKIGRNTSFVIKKNKLAPPYRSFIFPIIFNKGIDKLRDLVVFAEMLGVINKRGSYLLFDDVNLGLGINKTMEFLENNQEVLDKIKERCYTAIGDVELLSNIEKGDTDEEVGD